jgi:hypothetical protein
LPAVRFKINECRDSANSVRCGGFAVVTNIEFLNWIAFVLERDDRRLYSLAGASVRRSEIQQLPGLE